MLKLRKVELLGFKSFCEKTPITFSGSGITCIVGPNGCGKSNVVDAISWVLGEQSHKMLRAERMSDCIFNGTAKRPPMGISEVTLTLVDPELSDAVAKVIDAAPESAAADQPADGELAPELVAETPAGDAAAEAVAGAPENGRKPHWKKRAAEKPAITMRPGEVVVGRRLYRSGQSEYLINGRVARLRDVQEIFMGIGLGPDSYAIIEQGRIGQILNSKPMDRRAIIEEAAGITMYKTKKRLAETKLEASKINLSRVNDILVEVEKQLASLKRQASKARRYAELRDQMRGLLRIVLASKALNISISKPRAWKNYCAIWTRPKSAKPTPCTSLESEQERLSARTYELDARTPPDRRTCLARRLSISIAPKIASPSIASRWLNSNPARQRLAVEIDQAARQAADFSARIAAQRESVAALRGQAAALESGLRESTEHVSASSADPEPARITHGRASPPRARSCRRIRARPGRIAAGGRSRRAPYRC